MDNLKNKKILLIISGGISAYKTLDLIRLLKKDNVEIKTILTKSGKEFLTPLSISTLSGGNVYEDLFDQSNNKIDHIELSRWADLVVAAPATANLMSKVANGVADDLASTVILASDKDITFVPAMNVRMWENNATKNNINTLLKNGYLFQGPDTGDMACGEYGKGKMSTPDEIHNFIKDYFYKRDMLKKLKLKALVTSGSTREYIDPVRFISNESSGKQGYFIADELNKLGIETTLISGNTKLNYSTNFAVKEIVSGKEMLEEVKNKLPVDIAICAAAVSDFVPVFPSDKKIKKEQETNNIQIKRNVDILQYLGSSNQRPKLLIGFAAETNNLKENAKKKLIEKNCDYIIANDISRKDIGFSSDFNEITIFAKDKPEEKVTKNSKRLIARKITEKVINHFLINEQNIN